MKIKKLNDSILKRFYLCKTDNMLPYVSIKQFKSSCLTIEDEYVVFCFIVYLFSHLSKKSRIKYDHSYNILYDSLVCSPEELKEKIYLKLGVSVKRDDYKNYGFLEKTIIIKDYKKSKNGNYIKKGMTITNVLAEVLFNHFTDGYHASQTNENDDYLKLLGILEDEYGIDTSSYTPRNIAASIFRIKNIITVNRGVFKINDNSISISKELLSNIKKYIRRKSLIVRYQAIFDEFKNDLISLGIENRFILKSLLDPHLKKYITRRDDIAIKTDESFKEIVLKHVNKTKDIFSIDDLMEKFPGNERYVFSFIINEIDDLVTFENSSFIKIENLKLTNKTIEDLKRELELLIKEQNFTTSRKLYSRLVILNSHILKEIPLINSQFRMFSLLQKLFKNEYCFKRPIISLNSDKEINTYSLVFDYLNTLDKFDNKVLNDYLSKTGLRGVYSYLDFMCNMSDTFVQTGIDSMTNREVLNINQDFLNKLANTIDYYISNFGEIDTRRYAGYNVLPRINLTWNKYLLVGIIRTFLSERFEIEYTDNMYNKTDFIIRRLNNGQ